MANLNMNSNGMTAGIGGFLAPSATTWDFEQVDDTINFLRGGGCLARFQINIPTAQEAIDNESEWDIGLIDLQGFYHGLFQNNQGELFLYNGDSDSFIQVPINSFPRSVVGGD